LVKTLGLSTLYINNDINRIIGTASSPRSSDPFVLMPSTTYETTRS
jgi:hypothetical protein